MNANAAVQGDIATNIKDSMAKTIASRPLSGSPDEIGANCVGKGPFLSSQPEAHWALMGLKTLRLASPHVKPTLRR